MLISSGQRIIDRWRNPSNQTSEEQKTPIFFAQQGIIRIKADQGVTSIGRRRRGRVKGSSHVQASSRSVHFSDHYAWWLQSVLLSHEILLLTQRWVSVPPPPPFRAGEGREDLLGLYSPSLVITGEAGTQGCIVSNCSALLAAVAGRCHFASTSLL